MTTMTLTESNILSSTDLTPGGSIDDLVTYQQAVPEAIRILIFVNSDMGESSYWNIQKAPYLLHYLAVQSHTGEESIDKKLGAMVKALNTIKETLAHKNASEKFLAEALDELAELDDYAKEEEFDPPSPIAKELARKLLEELTRELPRYYAVSLWEDGDVVVYSASAGWRVSIYCRANGGASFYVNSPDKRDYEGHYESASDMPIALIFDALKKLSA